MTYMTENNRIFDSKRILVAASGFLIFNDTFVITSTGLASILEVPGGITKCSGTKVNGFPWIMLINMMYHITIILFGIIADLALYKYLKVKR